MMKDFVDVTHLVGLSYYVYVLYDNGTVMYVGMSGHIQQRLRKHRQRFGFDKVMAKPCVDRVEAECLERNLIVALNPRLNRAKHSTSYPSQRVDLAALGFDVTKYNWSRRGVE